MNREQFEKLPEEKRKIIEKAYFAAYNGEITPSDFFVICKQSLTPQEYSGLFVSESSGGTREQPQDEIKTEHLEDIMQYSGIDLKEEADNIVKEAEYNVIQPTHSEVDIEDQILSLMDVTIFYEFVDKVSLTRGVRITDDAIKLLFRVVKRKLLDLVERMDEASRVRTGCGLTHFGFKIENELGKQIWYLNELEKTKLEKLMIKKDEDQKKKKQMQEREDLLIKKRQSNSVAMAAMGLKQKSWMAPDEVQTDGDSGKFSSIYAPFDEKAFDKRIKDRTITMRDYIYVLERDKRYNKSVILIQHYFK